MFDWRSPSERHVTADPAVNEPLLQVGARLQDTEVASGVPQQFSATHLPTDDIASQNSSALGDVQQTTAAKDCTSRTATEVPGQPEQSKSQKSSDHTSSSKPGTEGAAASEAADLHQSPGAQPADLGIALSYGSKGQTTSANPGGTTAPASSRHHIGDIGDITAIYLPCITSTILNAILAMAAVASVLMHSLNMVFAERNLQSQHQKTQQTFCMGPEAAIFTHFITISLCLFSCSTAATAAIISHSTPRLANIALWASGIATAGSFCATITAFAFMAISQLGCSALGWVAFGLIIGLGGAAPVLFGGSIMICAAASRRRRRQHAEVRRSGLSKRSKGSSGRESRRHTAQNPSMNTNSAAGGLESSAR
ncbi:hypothetical protein WJX74_008236 [Apatococcus lobatus]|uniref:Uncharacterized protein n=1 Tax=Apatococcus lobatus TaxID=904363 RepID=A0AAW1SFF6_9CHLO